MGQLLIDQISLDEFQILLENSLRKVMEEGSTQATNPEPQLLYSIQELAEFLHCSPVTAQSLKNSGKIRFRQFGRKVIFSTAEILADIKKTQTKRQR